MSIPERGPEFDSSARMDDNVSSARRRRHFPALPILQSPPLAARPPPPPFSSITNLIRRIYSAFNPCDPPFCCYSGILAMDLIRSEMSGIELFEFRPEG